MPAFTETTLSQSQPPRVCLVPSTSGCLHAAVSPAPSNASSASFRPTPTHAAPITYGSGQLKKKKKRVVDSDDERCKWNVVVQFLRSPPPSLLAVHEIGTLQLQ
jgi:hypothetical protein